MNKIQLHINIGLILTLILITIATSLVIPLTAKAEVPEDYRNCPPVVTNFTASPTTLTKRDQPVTLSVTVQTSKCIIRGDVGNGSEWKIHLEFVQDDGKYFGNRRYLELPIDGFIRGSAFKRMSNVESSYNYNQYNATYKLTTSDLFKNETGRSLSLRPNVYWATDLVIENTNSIRKFTSPAAINTNTNNENSNSGGGTEPDTNVGVISNIDYDASVGSFFNPLETESVPALVASAVKILLSLAGMVAVLVIIIAGFRMVAGGGNPDEIKKAKAAITWAIIGLVVSLLSFSIVAIIQRIIQQ